MAISKKHGYLEKVFDGDALWLPRTDSIANVRRS